RASTNEPFNSPRTLYSVFFRSTQISPLHDFLSPFIFKDGRLVHPPRPNGQIINPIRPEMVTIIGSKILYRHKIPKLTSATIAVGRSVIARAPNTITAPVIAPVAAAVAPSTNALSWGLSRWRLNHGAGTI